MVWNRDRGFACGIAWLRDVPRGRDDIGRGDADVGGRLDHKRPGLEMVLAKAGDGSRLVWCQSRGASRT